MAKSKKKKEVQSYNPFGTPIMVLMAQALANSKSKDEK